MKLCEDRLCCCSLSENTPKSRCGLVCAWIGLVLFGFFVWPIMELLRYILLLPCLPIYGLCLAAEFICFGETYRTQCIGFKFLPCTIKIGYARTQEDYFCLV